MRRNPPPEAPPGFDLYETRAGLVRIDNPHHRHILSEMRGRELEVPAMLELTGLGKSTVSTHLSTLAGEGLVGWREHPEDRRRKLYFLTARPVASSAASRWELLAELRGQAAATGGDPGAFSRLLLRSLLLGIEASGLDLAPVLRETGRAIGEGIGRGLRPADAPGPATSPEPGRSAAGIPDLAALGPALASAWREKGLGTLTVETRGRIRISDCAVCAGLQGSAGGLCPLVGGVLEGAVNEALATSSRVVALDRTCEETCGCTWTVEP